MVLKRLVKVVLSVKAGIVEIGGFSSIIFGDDLYEEADGKYSAMASPTRACAKIRDESVFKGAVGQYV